MNVAFALALVAFVLQSATTATMFVIARAPGWERVRLFGFIALTAGLYSGVDVWAVAAPWPVETLSWVVRVNLTLAAIHASVWLLYTFGDERGTTRGMRPWLKQLAIGNVAVVGLLAMSGLVVAPGVSYHMRIPSLGVDYVQPQLSALGNLAATIIIGTFLVTLVEHVRRARAGVPGARGLVIGFALFLLCAVEEALVTSGAINFIFLADLGFLCAVLPVTAQLMRKFSNDAQRLVHLSERLAGEVQERTAERDIARDALLQQERLAALGRLAAGVGHEVNNPLQYLMFSLEELRESTSLMGRPDLEWPITNAFEGASRIRRVVDALRTYASPAGERFAPVDVRDVVRSALRIASPQLRHVANVETDLRDVPMVMGDEGQLVQIVVNPLVNAAQALGSAVLPRGSGEEVPTIRVTTRVTHDGLVEIEIADNGAGFAPDILPRLGEPYVTTKASAGGTGLGVFVTHGLVQAHRGTLSHSNASSGGAVVSIVLPARRDTPVQLVPRPTPPIVRSIRQRRVLIVDDEPLVLGALSRGLEKHGYEVERAADGAQALELIGSRSFDAIVSDLMMPHMSGMDLAAILASEYPQLRSRLIVITGGVVTPAAEAFVQQNGAVVLNKPIEMQALIATLESMALSA